MLTLVHVRLPPGFITSATPQRPSNIHMAYYKQGRMYTGLDKQKFSA